MGRPSIDNFNVILEINPQGIVTGLKYWDQEGCGHESEVMPLTAHVDKLALYHLDHCRRGHDVVPRVMCQFKCRGQRRTLCR